MTEKNRKRVFENIRTILGKMDDDWILTNEILPDSRLVTDLGFESIDIVVLCTAIENYYRQQFPFSLFFAQVGQREERDIRIEELVDLVCRHQDQDKTLQLSGQVARCD